MRIVAASALLVITVAVSAHATLSYQFQQNPISAAAIAADPELANMRSISLVVHISGSGHWFAAGIRAFLSPGHSFYQVPAARGGGNMHPDPSLFATFPELEFDTYVSSARNQAGQNPPSLLGGFPEGDPTSFGGANDPIPGIFSVSWGDAFATSGPGPGTYEIVRWTIPQTAGMDFHWQSYTAQTAPDHYVSVGWPEPASLAWITGGGLLLLRRGRHSERSVG